VTRALCSAGVAVALGGLVGCADPAHDAAVDALGPEKGSPGPQHRPGQPCVTCHGGSGPASAQFALGGTVYEAQSTTTGQAGVEVDLTDAKGASWHTTTNAAGNFYVRFSDWQPAYPVHNVQLNYPGLPAPTTMTSHIGRDGSCADCHHDPAGNASPGHVYLVVSPSDLPDGGA
jgi:hypothetical protein